MNIETLTYAQLSHAAFCGQITYVEMDAELARREAIPQPDPSPVHGVLNRKALTASAGEAEIRRRIECLRIAIGAAYTTPQHTFDATAEPWSVGDPDVQITLKTASLFTSCLVPVHLLRDPPVIPSCFDAAAQAMRRILGNP